MLESFSHPSYESKEQIFRFCLDILRKQAKIILNRETSNSDTLRKLEQDRTTIVRDYWEASRQLELNPSAATKLVLLDIISPSNEQELC